MYAIRSYYGLGAAPVEVAAATVAARPELPVLRAAAGAVAVGVVLGVEEAGVAGVPDAVAVEVLLRITSYNVCYTKLLRGCIHRTCRISRRQPSSNCFYP